MQFSTSVSKHYSDYDINPNESAKFVYAHDEAIENVQDKIIQLYEKDKYRVYFVRQLQVLFEKEHFHWITANALLRLEKVGYLKKFPMKRRQGGPIHFYVHRHNRYPKREINRKLKIVEEYSQEHIMRSCGLRAEDIFCAAFALHGFMPVKRNTRSYKKRRWRKTDHDLDFIFEKDNVSYGCELKNSLSYINKVEPEIKLDICHFLKIRPLFVMRMAPKTYIHMINKLGGYALIFKYQLYDLSQIKVVTRIKEELGLPVDCPRAIYEGTMQRLEKWHKKNVNLKKNSQR
jgi:hypothetical protein